jgi:hypothetical protein
MRPGRHAGRLDFHFERSVQETIQMYANCTDDQNPQKLRTESLLRKHYHSISGYWATDKQMMMMNVLDRQ